MHAVDSTGKKTITMKTTACHEKSRVSVISSARADGTKLKLMVVFNNAKRETSAMKKEFRRRHAVVDDMLLLQARKMLA